MFSICSSEIQQSKHLWMTAGAFYRDLWRTVDQGVIKRDLRLRLCRKRSFVDRSFVVKRLCCQKVRGEKDGEKDGEKEGERVMR